MSLLKSLPSLPSKVTLVEVGPRDGLQNEKQPVPTATKIELVQRLQAAGLREIEVTSFVSPKWVPQMADNAEVMAGIARAPGVRYSVLTPNLKGWEAAVLSRPDEIVVFGAASEAFSQKNINCSIAESIERFAPVVAAARAAGVKVRGAISCTVGCPYEGDVAPERVGLVARLMKAIGVQHVGVADTIGVGTPRKVQAALEAALAHYPLEEVSGHFHDTYGMAVANVYAALELGIATFDTSVSGLGGCPYQGEVTPDEVENIVRLMKGIAVDHCGVADTIGVGTPRRVQAAMERALKHFPIEEVSGHFHDTYGQALANIYACLEMGIHTFDASVAGLGGCPYAKGATGNVATEDVVFMLNGLDIQTGIDLDALVDAGAFISEVLGRPPVSRAGKALLAKREKAAA